MTQNAKEWVSAHLQFDGAIYGSPCDDVIVRVVGPACALSLPVVDQYFFVRYGVGGSHVRLRLHPAAGTTPSDARASLERLLDAVEANPVRAVAWVPYEPETDRYGGLPAMNIAEDIFHASSMLALDWLQEAPTMNRGARLGRALTASMVFARVFAGNPGEFLSTYSERYVARFAPPDRRAQWDGRFAQGNARQDARFAERIDVLARALDNPSGLPANLHQFYLRLTSARQALYELFRDRQVWIRGAIATNWTLVTRSIVPSYLHMMNNRIGVTIPEEAYVTYLAGRATTTRIA